MLAGCDRGWTPLAIVCDIIMMADWSLPVSHCKLQLAARTVCMQHHACILLLFPIGQVAS
jgi:hypothetical protein